MRSPEAGRQVTEEGSYSHGHSPLFSSGTDEVGKVEDVFPSEDNLEPRVLTMAAESILYAGRSDFQEKK